MKIVNLCQQSKQFVPLRLLAITPLKLTSLELIKIKLGIEDDRNLTHDLHSVERKPIPVLPSFARTAVEDIYFFFLL